MSPHPPPNAGLGLTLPACGPSTTITRLPSTLGTRVSSMPSFTPADKARGVSEAPSARASPPGSCQKAFPVIPRATLHPVDKWGSHHPISQVRTPKEQFLEIMIIKGALMHEDDG